MLFKKYVVKRVDPSCYTLLMVTSKKVSRLYSFLSGHNNYLVFKEYELDESCYFLGFSVVAGNCHLVESFLCSEKLEQPQAETMTFSYNPFQKLHSKSRCFKSQSEYRDLLNVLIDNEAQALTSEEVDYLKWLDEEEGSSDVSAISITPNFYSRFKTASIL